MKYRSRIQLYVLGATAVIYATAFTFFLWRDANQTKIESFKLVDTTVSESAFNVLSELSVDIGLSRSLAYTMSTYKTIPEENRNEIFKEIIFETQKNSPTYVSVWGSFERQYFMNGWDLPYGRDVINAIKIGNEFKMTETVKNVDGDIEGSSYYQIKKSKQEAFLDPYWYSLTEDGNNNILITSVCVPIMDGDNYIGLAGLDIDLQRYDQITRGVKPYESSFAMLISNDGQFVTAPSDTMVGKKIQILYSDVEKEFDVVRKIKNGESFSFLSEESGVEKYYSFSPVILGNSTTPWSLAVVTPKEEIFSELRKTQRLMILIGVLGLLLIALLVYRVADQVVKQIEGFIRFAKRINEGKFNAEIDVDRTDEIGDLGRALKEMANSINDMAIGLHKSSEEIDNTSQYLNKGSQELTSFSNRQAAAVEEVASSMEEMASNIAANTDNAKKTEEIAIAAQGELHETVTAVQRSHSEIQEIVEKITIISDIAFQTNILALNAAVEASRAGDSGRGFAVVAAEVRKLAERSRDAADSISNTANNVLSSSNDAKERIEHLLPEIEKTTSYVREISTAGYEQKNGADQINQSIQEINENTQHSAASAEEFSVTASELTKQADALKLAIGKFQVEDIE